ncbi:Rab11 family-interacting protein 5 [Triplophysa tibetana]|uniref:Rab11 family-interacting protein 5 n=1 Tax=Triplophysa tibetana TaxID=1572043 RepID=A0A5A9P983_9TELE|nr:Rab11 family-interacting protein 5 [Triplophysa tibetana]
MSLMESDEEHRWMPTHVQVTVLRARGLRAKGKHGTSDVYTIIQLGKEKYSTCLMEKTTDPEWIEECSFELQPGILEEGGRDAYPPGSADLTLTVMHRALIGLDVFLGQAVIPLDEAFQEQICKKSQWYQLHSKTGKKEKERGELQLTVQFTRHNLTASMYDLSVKDKPRSAFDKLRERMRVKKRTREEDSSSGIVAGGYGSMERIRSRSPSDGGGEEEYDDDEGGEARRSKMRSFFLRGRLRKSSDTRSSTSLGSESSESSSRGGSLSPTAGISVVVSDLSNSPSNSSNLTADSPDHTMAPSPQVSPVRHVYAHEIDFSLPVPHSVTSENNTPILLPSVCVNGNPVETSPLTHHPPSIILQQPQPESTKLQATKLPDEPQTTRSTGPKSQTSAETKLSESKPRPSPQLPALGLIQKGSSHSLSLQNLSRRGEEKRSGGPVDGRRWSFDKPGEEEKAAIVAALECAGRVTDESVMETVIPVGETETLSKKRRGLFSHGKGESNAKGPITSKEEAEHAQQLVEVKHKGWFGSKDSHSKPSSLVSSKSDSSSSVICPIAPSQNMADKDANPFTSPPPLFDANPFFPLAQPNPFFQEFPTDASLTPSLSSSAQYQSEPDSSWSGVNPTPDLLRIGNSNGPSGISKVDGSIDASIFHFEDEADFGIFAEDRLKSSEKGKERQNMVTTHTVFVKPKNEEPLGGLDSLTDKNDLTYLEKTASAGTTTGEMSKESSAYTPQVSGSDGNSNKSDLIYPDPFGFPEFNPNLSEINLPENSSLEFSALNALVCPHPALSNVQNNEVNGNTMTPRDWPEMCLTSQNAKPSFTQPSLLDDIFNTELITIELSDDARGSPEEPEFAKNTESVKINEDPVPCCRDSDDALVPSSKTSYSQGKELDNLSFEPGHFTHCDFTSSIKQSDGVLDSDASFVESSTTSGFHSPSVPSSPLSIPLDNEDNLGAGMDTKFQNESEDGLSDSSHTSDLFSEITFHVPDNLNDISFSSSNTVSNEVHVDEQKVCEFPNYPSKDDLIGSVLSSSGEVQEIKNSDGQTIPAGYLNPTTEIKTGTDEKSLILNSALSPPSVIVHSMYRRADSDHYFTCVSQQDSISPSLELTQELKPKHDQSEEDILLFGSLPEHITVPDVMPKAVEEMDCVRNQPRALASGDNHSLYFPSSAFDPLPVASSTPHVVVDTNAMPQQFPFPIIPSTSVQSWPHPALNDPFLPDNSPTTNHQSSPHPVKPLTPPDDKRSEGRSVLEKLKSTIHSGRSHHSDQDADKKLLVEGGGSYYHLNHSELVNLLIQRDTELKQEREEYQKRGALLVKREMDLKKMKATIRDLEDYIDTLLVRIMEQTPTLLQVNPRKK